MSKIKILFFSGNRAEFSFIHNAIISLQKEKIFDLEILISGSHLENKFGETFQYVKKKLQIKFNKIKINSSTKNISKTADYYSELTTKFNLFLKKKNFDYIFISSDRFESFAVANVAFMNNLQIIHYEGGDITEGGSYDDYIRHSISRLASLHFVTNKYSKKRLIKFGEESKRIENVGLLSLENKKYNLNKIIKKFSINENKQLLLFTYHPVVKRKNKNRDDIKLILNILEKFILKNKIQLIITYPNFDPYCDLILSELKKIEKKKLKDVQFHKSLGTENYHELLYYCGKTGKGMCVGNSSSGIKDAEFFNCNTLNIGPRQNLRTKGKNVCDVILDPKKIHNKIQNMFLDKNNKKLNDNEKIYYKKNFSKLMANKIIKHYKNNFLKIKKCTY